MALVSYSSTSESESDHNSDEGEPNRKAQRVSLLCKEKRLLFPSAIKLFNSAPITDIPPTSDNPSEHDGRIRSFKHERGNWATFVYIPVKQSVVEELQELLQEKMKGLVELKISSDIHISLSRTVVIQYHWINSLIESLQKAFQTLTKFSISLQVIKIYLNDERTRTFVGFKVDEIYFNKLSKLITDVDVVMKEYNLQKFYEDPSFHASILWCVGDHEVVLKKNLPKLQAIVDALTGQSNGTEEFKVHVNAIHCKTGNKEFQFALR